MLLSGRFYLCGPMSQEAFARSLGHSTGSNVVFLDSIALDAVRSWGGEGRVGGGYS